MKVRLLVFVVVLVAMPSMAAVSLGDNMPAGDIMMKNVDSKQLNLSQVAGEQGTLVVFSCNHCPWAKAWEERIVDIGNSYQKKNVGVIIINSNDPKEYPTDSFEHMQARAKEKGYDIPYVVDAGSIVTKAFGASRTPEVFLFDAQNTLVYTGAVDDNSEDASAVTKTYLKDALDALLAGKPITTSETKSIGCSIKFY
jgi:peroxiredoxin